MQIALLGNDEICYGSLQYCLQRIKQVLEKKGIQTEIVTSIDNDFISRKWSAVIGINQCVFSAQFDDGEYVFDSLGCPLFLLILDSPYHHDSILRQHPKNLNLICLDRKHLEYGKQYYEPFQSIKMGFVLGSIAEPRDYKEREIDFLFSGTHLDIQGMEQKIMSYPQKWVPELFTYLVEKGMEDPDMEVGEHILPYFEKKGMRISREDYKTAMGLVGTNAEFYLRGYYREKIMDTLAKAGVSVTIIGDGWNDFCKQYPGNFKILPSVPFSEMGAYLANSKIVLNVMPWFKDGMHDRVPTSMHCGAVCLTDKSSYMEEVFSEGKNIVFYDLRLLVDLPGKVVSLLENPERAEQIAKNGREFVKDRFTWERMVDDTILSVLQ